METFEITKDHLMLLQHVYVGWQHCEFGAPAIDCKRPYGNSDVESDIADILTWDVYGDGELTYDQQELAIKLHKETQTALQICLAMCEFKTGIFKQVDPYNERMWKRIV